ncbi:MAG: DivIVA domain-containing protein [Actinomycetales bacterium]|nr:DivIVA domain-containing protein [Actinomycetales bacterium]
MPLTPEDVVNKRFQPTKFREGYDQDEVDDFLDEIVVELRRLSEENEDLRQRLLAADARIAELQRSGAGLAEQLNPNTPAGGIASLNPNSAVSPILPSAPSAFPEATQDPSSLDSNNTNNLLQLARKLHEEHVREGLAKRDALIAEGHATAARIVREAESQHRADMSRLEQEKALIEHSIQALRSTEREYRAKLKGFIESQLTELEVSDMAPTESVQSKPALGTAGFATFTQSNPIISPVEPAAPVAPSTGSNPFGGFTGWTQTQPSTFGNDEE